MATASSNPPFVLKRAVLVSINNQEVLRFARLRLAYDNTTNKGSISLTIGADIANLSGRSQLILSIPPESVQECILAQPSNDSLFTLHWLKSLPAPVTNILDVLTLSLILSTTGSVLCPSGIESLHPADPKDSNFGIFTKICKSRSLHIHFSTRQFTKSELDQLESLSVALQKRSVQEEPLNYARQSVVKRDWRAFGLLLDPPPYSEEPIFNQGQQLDPPLYHEGSSSEQVARKRYRDQWSFSLAESESDEKHKRPRLPSSPLLDCPTEANTPTTQRLRLPSSSLGSPTEVNTPSAPSLSPSSIRPTHFTHTSSPSRIDRNRLAHIAHELRGVPDKSIRKVLIQSGHRHLLAIPGDTESDSRSESRNSGFAKVERRLRQYVRQYVDLVLDTRAVLHIDKTVNRAVNEVTDQVFDIYKTKEAEFCEQVDDGITEIRIKANDCLLEMEDTAQKCTHEIEDQGEQYMNDIEKKGIEVEMAVDEKVAQFKRWFNTPAQSLLGDLHTNARRSSI
ncbi:hypothetical protein BJX63DRAFT_442454 [Aspergillus granulosus]|uniref:Uncharacterized protein n=1 Tax=Aspergillus granulosus TaxID=176169 RepID=A0ABR4HGL9_9EURO